MSNDPRFAGSPKTPAPVICEFCRAERYTEGFVLFNDQVFWNPCGAIPCDCPEGRHAHDAEVARRKAEKEAEEKREADYAMRKKVDRIISESGMGERFLQRTFETFKGDTPERKKNIAAAKGYAKNFDKQLPKRGAPLPVRNGLLISGTKGTGKTHIAAAIANYLLGKGTAVICMTERNLFGEIKRTYSGDAERDESEIRRIYETVPLLIIDDLGKEKPTPWTLSTLYAIIDGRYDRAMPLIITTNYDAKSLVEKLTPLTPEGMDTTTAEAIMDRLLEMCESIVTSGDSWRLRQ